MTIRCGIALGIMKANPPYTPCRNVGCTARTVGDDFPRMKRTGRSSLKFGPALDPIILISKTYRRYLIRHLRSSREVTGGRSPSILWAFHRVDETKVAPSVLVTWGAGWDLVGFRGIMGNPLCGNLGQQGAKWNEKV